MDQGARCRGLAWTGIALALVLSWTDRAAAQCVGDCDGDGQVSATEITTGVDIALLRQPPSSCTAFSPPVEIDQLVLAVDNRLTGCAATPTPSPSATESGTPSPTPTATSSAGPTNTPGGVPNAVAGGAAVVAKSLGGIPSLVTAIVTGLTYGNDAAAQGSAAGACPEGGTAQRTCTTPTGGGAQLSIALASCAVSVPDGTLTFNTPQSPITLTSQSPAACPLGVSPFAPIEAVGDVTAVVRDSEQNVTLSTRATLTAVVEPQIPVPPPVCVLNGADLIVTGTLTAAIPGNGGTILTLTQTSIELVIQSRNIDCVPVQYTLTFDGAGAVRDTGSNEMAAIRFDDFVVRVDARTTPTLLDMDGGLNFDCVAGDIVLDTVTSLTSVAGQLCPAGGRINITSPEGPSVIQYLSDGSVQVDVTGDGTFDTTFDSCVDPMLALCPQQP
jgi:hypothetical protein